jgi:hypothetical protein
MKVIPKFPMINKVLQDSWHGAIVFRNDEYQGAGGRNFIYPFRDRRRNIGGILGAIE